MENLSQSWRFYGVPVWEGTRGESFRFEKERNNDLKFLTNSFPCNSVGQGKR
jgi:hypothetical protein